MAELLAVKLPDGKPHDLGQFYILMDPSTYGADFGARFVPDALWALVTGLAHPEAS